MSDKDRKEWELTDREVFDNWRPDAPLESSQRAIATAASRKALEWAVRKCDLLAEKKISKVKSGMCYSVVARAEHCADALRKELSDG